MLEVVIKNNPNASRFGGKRYKGQIVDKDGIAIWPIGHVTISGVILHSEAIWEYGRTPEKVRQELERSWDAAKVRMEKAAETIRMPLREG